MSIAWLKDSFTIREVFEQLKLEGPIAYTTVQTVMARLVERGLLARKMAGNVGQYQATRSTDHLAASQLVDQLFGRFGTLAVAQFVEHTRKDAELFAQLRDLVDSTSEDQPDATP